MFVSVVRLELLIFSKKKERRKKKRLLLHPLFTTRHPLVLIWVRGHWRHFSFSVSPSTRRSAVSDIYCIRALVTEGGTDINFSCSPPVWVSRSRATTAAAASGSSLKRPRISFCCIYGPHITCACIIYCAA